ncbi:MAG: Gfo/Idh/MocA family oxidoreductase [Rhodospirillales bacterium]
MNTKELGIAVVGSGRIGTLRANMARRHPSVGFLAVSDIDKNKAEILKQRVGADLASADNYEIISHPDVNAVVVSTPEFEHVEAVRQALELKKPVFLEKPLALSMEDGKAIIAAVEKFGGDVVVGYSRRHDRRWMLAKEQIVQGRVGEIIGIQSRVYNSRAQMLELIKRSLDATPVLDVLTYYVDMANWFLDGIRPVEVVARSHGKVFKKMGYDTVEETNWTIITYENGAIVNLGIFYGLPTDYPGYGQSGRFEVLGEDGAILLDIDNKDSILTTEKGVPHNYIPDLTTGMLFMQSGTSGDWALDEYWGPIANETRSWLDHLITGAKCPHTTVQEAMLTLQVSTAIEEAARTKQTVAIPRL